MAPAQSCGLCFYYLASPGLGVCRRYPPQMMGTASAAFPPIPAAQWCGEFQPISGASPMSGTVLYRPAGSSGAWTTLGQVPTGSELWLTPAAAPPVPNQPSPDGTTV